MKLNLLCPSDKVSIYTRRYTLTTASILCENSSSNHGYMVLVGKPEGKRKLGRSRHRWEDNIKMDLQKLGWGMDGLMWLRIGIVAGSCACSNELSGSIKCGEFLD